MTTSNNEVTVGIPAFNAEPFLERAVRSVRVQQWPIREILVVDDGSSDGTARLAASLGCRVVSHEFNRGDAAARNTVLQNAGTEFVAWLDADDEWLPHHLQSVVPTLRSNDRAAVAFGSVRFTRTIGEWPIPAVSRAGAGLLSLALHRCLIPQNAAVVRRTLVNEIGGYREHLRLASDFDLWCRLGARFDLVGVDVVTAVVHEHPNQTSRTGHRYFETEYSIRREYLHDPHWHRELGVTAAWLRKANADVWRSHVNTTWHTREFRLRAWYLRQHRGHAPLGRLTREIAYSALLPLAAIRDRIRGARA